MFFWRSNMNTVIQNDLVLAHSILSVCESIRFPDLTLLRVIDSYRVLLKDFDDTSIALHDFVLESDIREVRRAYSFIEGKLITHLQSEIESTNNKSDSKDLIDIYIKLVQNQSIRTDLVAMTQKAKTLLLLSSDKNDSKYNGILDTVNYLRGLCLEHIDIKSTFDLTTYEDTGNTLWKLYLQLYKELHYDFLSLRFTGVPDRQLAVYLLNFSNAIDAPQSREQFINKVEDFLQSGKTPRAYSPSLVLLSNFYCKWEKSFIDYIRYSYQHHSASHFNDKGMDYYLTLVHCYIIRIHIVALFNKLFVLQAINSESFSSIFDDVTRIFNNLLSRLNILNEIPNLLPIMDNISCSLSSCDTQLRNLFALYLEPKPNNSQSNSRVNLLQL